MPKQTKQGHCRFCGKHTDLYPLPDGTGKTLWACQTVTNPALPDFTCYNSWKNAVAPDTRPRTYS